jgi:hypothetical protein
VSVACLLVLVYLESGIRWFVDDNLVWYIYGMHSISLIFRCIIFELNVIVIKSAQMFIDDDQYFGTMIGSLTGYYSKSFL